MNTTTLRDWAATIAAGGPVLYEFDDYDYFGDFITNQYVKSYWIAFYILSLYWGFFWFCRHIFGDGNNNMFNRQEAVHNLESDRNRNSRRHLMWTNTSTAINIFVGNWLLYAHHINPNSLMIRLGLIALVTLFEI